MESLKITLIKTTLIGFLGFHLLVHVLYLAPTNPATPEYSLNVAAYMNSFFGQTWHLFAPEPATSSLDLQIRCSSIEKWQSPLEHLFKEHKAFPFTARGKQTYVIQNIARQIFNSKIKNLEDMQITELGIAYDFLKDQCGNTTDSELQVKRVYTKDYSKRLSDASGRVDSFQFKVNKGSVTWAY